MLNEVMYRFSKSGRALFSKEVIDAGVSKMWAAAKKVASGAGDDIVKIGEKEFKAKELVESSANKLEGFNKFYTATGIKGLFNKVGLWFHRKFAKIWQVFDGAELQTSRKVFQTLKDIRINPKYVDIFEGKHAQFNQMQKEIMAQKNLAADFKAKGYDKAEKEVKTLHDAFIKIVRNQKEMNESWRKTAGDIAKNNKLFENASVTAEEASIVVAWHSLAEYLKIGGDELLEETIKRLK